MPKKKQVKIFLVNVILLIGFLASIEIFSFLIIQLRESYKKNKEDIEYVRNWNFEFHPSVSNTHTLEDFKNNPNALNSSSTNNIFTQKLYGNSKRNKINILILGGSTSDPLGSHFSGINGTWPDQLGSYLSQYDKNQFEIINAAVGGATSSQELLRLILLLQQKEPNIIISLNGLNEIYFMHHKLYEDFNNIYASKMTLQGLSNNKIIFGNKWFCKNICIPNNTAKLVTRINKKLQSSLNSFLNVKRENKPKKLTFKTLENSQRAAKIWKNNVIAMHAIAKIKNANYLVFLQPTYGLDIDIKSFINEREKERESNLHPIKRNMTIEYILKINSLYSNLRTYCKQLDFCVDLSKEKSLNSSLSLFKDARHHNREGNKQIAITLGTYLRNKNLIK